jgi:hypothetical protein
VAVKGVTEEGFDANGSIKRDPPFIFETEAGCEESLEDTDPLEEEGFDVNGSIKRDPPFIFEREVGCENSKIQIPWTAMAVGEVLVMLSRRGRWSGR